MDAINDQVEETISSSPHLVGYDLNRPDIDASRVIICVPGIVGHTNYEHSLRRLLSSFHK